MITLEVVRSTSILVLQNFYFNFEAERYQKNFFFYTKLIFSSQLFFPLLLIPKMLRFIVRLEPSNRSARLGNAEKPICGNSQSCEEHKLFRVASEWPGNCRDYLFLRGDVAELAYSHDATRTC